MLSISSLSTEYVIVPVYVTKQGAAYNPTADAVQFAFKQGGDIPLPADWIAGTWWTSAQPDGSWNAQLLIGPSAPTVLAVGMWDVWIKVTDFPEIPVQQLPAFLQITP